LKNGENAITAYGNNVVNWNEGNIADNPLWQEEGDFPYSLTELSPCIDNGSPDTTGLALPEFDLAGNDRIYNDIIDMGAFEWQNTGVEEPEIPHLSPLISQLSNYPNPFNPSTTISFNISGEQNAPYELAIYNLKGQKVKTLDCCNSFAATSGSCRTYSKTVIWDGTDQNNKPVSSGIYFARLKSGKAEVSCKMLLLK